MTAPDWLQHRNGHLSKSPDGRSWLVMLEGTPRYRLTPGPAGGQYSCNVHQTVGGQRIDVAGTHASADAAVGAGLEALRAKLGW